MSDPDRGCFGGSVLDFVGPGPVDPGDEGAVEGGALGHSFVRVEAGLDRHIGEDLGHGLTELGHPRRTADDLDTVQGFRKAITVKRKHETST